MLESRSRFLFWMHLAQAFSNYSVAKQGAVPLVLSKPMDFHCIYRSSQDTLGRYKKHPSSHPEIYLKWPKKSGLTTDIAKTCWGVATSMHLHLILLALTPPEKHLPQRGVMLPGSSTEQGCSGLVRAISFPRDKPYTKGEKQLPPKEPDLRHSPWGGATLTSSEVLLQQ